MAKSILQYVHQVGSTSMRRPIIWISLSLANFICIGFLLWLSLSSTHLGATVELTNTTFYSTHPKVAYAPESCCVKGPFGRCKKRYDPFTLSTYVDPDSTKRTFFQTSSWGNEPESSNMKRRVEITFYGRAVYVYGPPRTQLTDLPGRIQVSLNGRVMEIIDLEAKYGEANEESWSPQLMYTWTSGAGDATHTLVISLLDASSEPNIRGFGFDSVVFTSLEPWSQSKYEPRESETLENVVIQDTNFVTSFAPSYAWQKNISAVASSDGMRTFHVTSNRLAYDSRNSRATPIAEFTAQCAALAMYGASPVQLKATLAKGFRHGHLQICRRRNCEYIDAHQAYLHVPERLWSEPVLLYGTDRMSPNALETVTMKFLNPPSPVGHLWAMSFSHAVCSQVVPRWPGTHPIPNAQYSTHVIPFDRLTYAPSFLFGAFTPWSRMDLYSSAPAELYWFSGVFRSMPRWSTVVRGHDIKIFVPSPALFPEFRYANVRCCVDGRCHYPDIEQWLLKGTDTNPDVLVVHYQDLNPFEDHRISMTAVRGDDEAGEKIIAVSRVVYERVEVATDSIPSNQTEHPHIPAPKEPIQYPGGTSIFVALALIFIGCFVIYRIKKARQHSFAREPLSQQPLPQSWLPTAAPAPPIDIPLAYCDYPAPPPYTAESEDQPPRRPHPPMTRPATPPLL